MPITTDTFIEVKDNNNIVLDTIELSKPLSQSTIEELVNFGFCSNTDMLFRDIRNGTPAGSTINGVGFTNVSGGVPCRWSRVTNPSYWILRTEQGENGNQNNMGGLYKIVVWLYGADPTSTNPVDPNNPKFTDLSAMRVVTKWNAPHYLFDVSGIGLYNTGDFGASGWASPKTNPAFEISGNNYTITYNTNLQSVSNVAYNIPMETNHVIKPYNLFLYNGNVYIKPIIPISSARSVYGMASTYFTTFNATSTSACSCVLYDSTGNNPIGVNNTINKLYSDTAGANAISFPYDVRVDNNGTNYGVDGNGYKFIYQRIGNASPSRSVRITYLYSNVDDLKLFVAGAGVHFKADKVYKPIIHGGHVDGFTDELATPSDLDKWTGNTNHGVTPTPSGMPSGDELTDMLSRGQFYGSGLTRYYVNVPAAKLQKALGDWDNIQTGKDVLQNLLSYKILCFPSTTFSNGMTEPFVIAGTELKDENDTTITAQKLTSTGAINLPNITITPTFNDFRDFAPYTKIQMFVPLCGWFDLPPWCMGRKISGEMYINPYSGTVRCLVRADGNVVAELGGNASIDLPFNATAVGMKSAAVLSNLIQTAGAVGRAAMLPTVNTLAGAGSAALGTICAMNANYTESKGTMGDGSNVYGLYNVYIKITRPATIDNSGNSLVTIPAQYCHDYGRPCNKQLTLAAGDGYTQVMDANIAGAMTDREKQMIIDGFRHGLIL